MSSRKGEPLTEGEINLVARIRADGGDVEECFESDGRRFFRVLKATAGNDLQIVADCTIQTPPKSDHR